MIFRAILLDGSILTFDGIERFETYNHWVEAYDKDKRSLAALPTNQVKACWLYEEVRVFNMREVKL